MIQAANLDTIFGRSVVSVNKRVLNIITCSRLTVKFEVARILNQASLIWNPIDQRLMHSV